jgi:hypothetical protein
LVLQSGVWSAYTNGLVCSDGLSRSRHGPDSARLVILKGTVPIEPSQLQALKSVFEVIEFTALAAAKKMLDGSVGGYGHLCARRLADDFPASRSRMPAGTILERIGEGIGVVDANGSLQWTDARFKVHEEQTRASSSDLPPRS